MDSLQEQASGYDETTPVLIVGGSLVGLSMSIFLSWHGISSLLVERHAGISPHPRAFNFNMRTMEFFRAVGVEEAIRRKAPPDFQSSSIVRAESLAGRELHSITQDTTSSEISPICGCIIGQDALEPVLRARAEELGGDLRFSTELVSFEQTPEGVRAVIRDRASGAERTVQARYLVAADGNRSSIRQQLGTKTHGPGILGHQLSILFDADVRTPLRGRRLAVCFILNPSVRKGTSLVFARNGQGFALFVPFYPDQGEREEDFAGERGIEMIRAAIGIPDLPVEIINVTSWSPAVWAAASFQQENVFLVGDAAHVMPPAGAFGANTGIADAYNLAWKLALALQGQAGPALLPSYTAERQPVVRHTAEQSFAMFTRFNGVPTDKPTVPMIEYDSIAFGYRYHSDVLLEENEEQAWCEDPHHPSGRTGTRAPHVIVTRSNEQLSTIDLLGRNFVLFAGEAGEAWRQAADDVARRMELPLDAYCIGERGDLVDVDQRFLEAYGLREDGAVLIRPDGFIGWRAETASTKPVCTLEQALSRLLGRSPQH